MKLSAVAKKLQEWIKETLTYMDFPTQHWTRIRTNNTVERLNWPYQGNRSLSRWAECFHVSMRQTPPCSRNPVGVEYTINNTFCLSENVAITLVRRLNAWSRRFNDIVGTNLRPVLHRGIHSNKVVANAFLQFFLM